MENKTIDRRIQRTRQLIQDSLMELILEKGYDTLTVQDIIDRANVGRSTFYVHFPGKEELLLSVFDHLIQEFEKHLMIASAGNNNPWMLGLSMLQHAQSQRALYKALAGKQGGNIALLHIQKYLSNLLLEHMKVQLANQKNSPPAEIVAHYISSTFISLLTWWLDTDSTYSAEEMNEFYLRLVQPGIEELFGTAKSQST